MAGQGFKSLTPERHAAESSKGGKAAHAKGTAHQWTSKEAREAALKGVAKRREKAAARANGATEA